jgi:Fic family protein
LDLGVFELDPQGRRCFRPDAPPFPAIDDIHDLLDPAATAVREFDRALSGWQRPDLVGRLFARLDAVHSSGADGSTTTFSDLMEYRSSLRSAPDPDDAAAVAVCAEAVDTEPRNVDPVEAMLRIHRRLFAHSRDPVAMQAAGRLKPHANGTPDRSAPSGFLYYTRPSSVAAALDDWRTFTLGFDLHTPEMVRQILSHWMFAHIHPVAGGNGRIGRVLVPLMLRRKGATRAPCAFFGEAVHEEKNLYGEALRAARMSGDMVPWTRLMLSFLERTATANLARLGRLAALDAEWRRIAATFRSDSMVHKLAPFALTRPAFSMRDALDAIGGTFASVNTAATRLVEAGVLTISDGARRDRLFQAGAVLEMFDRFRAARGGGRS